MLSTWQASRSSTVDLLEENVSKISSSYCSNISACQAIELPQDWLGRFSHFFHKTKIVLHQLDLHVSQICEGLHQVSVGLNWELSHKFDRVFVSPFNTGCPFAKEVPDLRP